MTIPMPTSQPNQPGLMSSPQGISPPGMPAPGQPTVPQQKGFTKGPAGQFDMFFTYCIKVIHSKDVADNIAKSLAGLTDINQQIDHIARLSLDIVTRVQSASDQKNQQIGDDVIANALNHTISEVITIGQIAGMKKLTDEQKAQAFSLSVSLYLDQAVKSGRLTKEQVQQAAIELSKTKQGQSFGKTRAEILAKSKKSAPPQPPTQDQGGMPPQPQAGPAGGMTNG